MFQTIKTHKWAALFAFLAGAIVVSPQLYFPYDQAGNYQGIYIATTDSEACYLVNIKEVQDGHPMLGSAVFKDGKGDPFFKPPGPEILIGYLGKIFSLDINNTLLLSRFLLSFLGFLAIYAFVFLITKEKLTGLAAAAAVLLAKSIIDRGALLTLIRGGDLKTDFLEAFRPVHSQTDFPFFFGFLLFFWMFLNTPAESNPKKRWVFGAISIMTLGLSFYFYPYIWSFLYVFMGILFAILLFLKKRQNLKGILLVALGGIIISIPYFLTVYKADLYPYFEDVLYRTRYMDTRSPILGILVPSLFIIFLTLFPKKPRERFIFCLSLLAAPFFVLNQQIVTGGVFSPRPYHWDFNKTLALIFFIIIFFFKDSPKRGNFQKNFGCSCGGFQRFGGHGYPYSFC